MAADGLKFKSNLLHICIFMVIIVLSGMTQGYGIAVANQLANTFNVKYGWDTLRAKTIH